MNLKSFKPLLIVGALAAAMSACAEQQPASTASAAAQAQTAYPQGIWQPESARYGAESVSERIKLADGTELEANVAYPTEAASGKRAQGAFPVLIEFSPYSVLSGEIKPMTYFVERGYIVALVRPRGAGSSTGELQQFSSQDGKDGKEVVDWAAKLEGSNGKVGLFGCSYPGATALTTAAFVEADSPVKAVLASCIGLGAQYRQAWTNNGLPTALVGSYPPNAKAMMGGSAAAERHFMQFHQDFFAAGGSAYDRDFWQDRIPIQHAEKIANNNIPVLMWGGWQDLNETGAIRGYVAFQNALAGRDIDAPMTAGQKTSPRYQLIIGDWAHAHGLDLGVYLQWFDTWLKEQDTGLADTATPLHLYEAGTERWVNLAQYPAVDNYTTWYLSGNGEIRKDNAPDSKRNLLWTSPDNKDGKIIFESEAIAEGATLSGPMNLQVFAQSNNRNLVLIARLYDIAPNGDSREITRGTLLGSLSELDDSATWKDTGGKTIWAWPKLDQDRHLTPNQTTSFDIALEPVQYGVQPNHKLRLEISTQSPTNICSPEGKALSFAAEPCGLTTAQQQSVPGGEYTLFFGKETPTALNLPLLPFKVFSEVNAGKTPTAWNETQRIFEQETEYTLPMQW